MAGILSWPQCLNCASEFDVFNCASEFDVSFFVLQIDMSHSFDLEIWAGLNSIVCRLYDTWDVTVMHPLMCYTGWMDTTL